MEKIDQVWLVSIISSFFVFCIVLVALKSFAEDPATIKSGDSSIGETGNIAFEVLNPQAEIIKPSKISVINPRVKDLSDKNIGVIWCGKSGGENYLEAVSRLLKEKYPSATISRFSWLGNTEKVKEDILRDVDTFVYGVGDSGLGAWESTSRAILLERLGKPGVVIIGEHHMHIGKASASAQGMPSVRIIGLPSIDFYQNRSSVENIMPCAIASLSDIIDAITRPVQPSEKKAEMDSKEPIPDRLRITAGSLESAHEKFNQLFMDNNWGDGLPLIPPTPENVKRMLKGTKLPPDTVLGVMQAPDGIIDTAKVTVEKVAINAVMAGAKPEYLPVIIAAMEGVSDRDFSPHVFTSDGSFTLFIAVTGPIAKKINMNSGVGLLGHGWRANNTIGRAVRLCLNNIGNYKPGGTDMALIGRPSSHTFYVLAENDELNPWGPYHTVRGYRAEDSYVTVSGIGGGMRIFSGGTGATWTVKGVLDNLVKEVGANRMTFSSLKPGEENAPVMMYRPLNYIFVLNPEMALGLEKMGLNRRGLVDYLIEKTSIPYEELSEEAIQDLKERLTVKTEAFFGSTNIPDDRVPVIRDALRPGGKVPTVISSEDINVFVSGIISGYTFGMSYLRGAHMVKRVQ
jgi:hypothetical protein